MPTLGDLAAVAAAELVGDPSSLIEGVNTLDEAGPTDLSFLSNPLYTEAMKHTKAGAVCVGRDAPRAPGKNFLVADNPSAAFQKIAEFMLGVGQQASGFQGVHPTAVIHPSAK